MRRKSLPVALAIVLLSVSQATSQDTPPRLVLTTGGPVAPVYALAFSPAGDRLFSAGGDKMLRSWDVRQDDDGLTRTTLAKRFYWNVSPGDRGRLNAISLSPDGKLVAMAGFSARTANGDIYVLDSATGKVNAVLGYVNGENQHRATVVTLCFSPDGRHLVSVSEDGEARVWDTAEWGSRQLAQRERRLQEPRPAVFLSDSRVALAERILTQSGEQSNAWRIAIHDVVAPGNPQRLEQLHKGSVMALAYRNGSNRWASADNYGNVFLWDDVNYPRASLLRNDLRARSMTFGAPDQLLIATARESTTPARLELWDCEKRIKLDQTNTSVAVDNFACAASADGQYVAAMYPDENELRIWSLLDANGRSRDEPLSKASTVRLKGSGEPIWKVAFDRQSYQLGFGQQLRKEAAKFGDFEDVTRAFDLNEFKVVDPAGEWRTHLDGGDDWSIGELPKEGTHTVPLRRRGAEYAQIDLDETYQGKAISYCWLSAGNNRPYGIALGTEKQNGVFVYQLPDRRNGTCRLLRYFRDHRGKVTSLSVSHDGRYLASASTDQTVKIWSLDGLPPAAADATQAAWGATFQPRRDEEDLLVAAAMKAGIIASRGLEQGDAITRVQYQKDGQYHSETDPVQMLRVLEEAPLWQFVVLSFIDQGDARRAKREVVTPAWEPLLTLFVDSQNNWAAWTQEGYYDSSAVGDRMFGWLVFNGTLDVPTFHPASHFRKDLERPQVMRRLMLTGNLSDALSQAGENVPGDLRQRVNEVAVRLPTLEILEPTDNASFGGEAAMRIVARVTYPDQASATRYNVKCFINSSSAGEASRDGGNGLTYLYRWQAKPVSERNRINVVVEDQYAGPATSFVDASVVVKAQLRPQPFTVHLVTISGNDYEEALSDLKGAEDAKRFSTTLREVAGPFFQMGHEITLAESQVSAASLRSALEELRRVIGDSTRDLVVFYAAGHGVEFESEYYYLPASPSHNYLSGGAAIKQHGIPWKIIRSFGELPCRKLFLLDTCRQSVGGQSFTGENAAKASIRPLGLSGSLIITATQNGNKAWESLDRRGGIFTQSLVEALQGQADGFAAGTPRPPNRDDRVDVDEVTGFVPIRVKDIQKDTLASLKRGEVALLKLDGYGTQIPWVSENSIGDPLRLAKRAPQNASD